MSRARLRRRTLVAATAVLGLGATALVAPAALAGPTSLAPAAVASPDPRDADTAKAATAAKRPKRGLTVKLVVPSALRGKVKVKVTGPKSAKTKTKKRKKFKKSVKRTTSWKSAKAGTYRVTAPSVTLNGLTIKPTFSPSKKVKVRKAKKGKRRGARITVTYKVGYRCTVSGAKAYAWGDGTSGAIGNGSTARRTTATKVTDLSGVLAVTGGNHNAYATCSNGTVWSWGNGGYGQLGNGGTRSSSYAVRVSGLTRVTGVAARDRGALAVRDDGTVWSWGWARYGQLGNGTSVSSSAVAKTPVKVAGLTNVHAVAAGANTSYALKKDGTLWAWGQNGNGQLGNGTTTDAAKPVQVKGVGGTGVLTGAKAVVAGNATAYALTGSLAVVAWGAGGRGQLGNGAVTNSSTPVPVKGVGGVGTLTGAVGIAAGHISAYAVLGDGTVRSWGDDSQGQLGDGGAITNTYKSTPVTIPGLSGVRYLASNGYTAYATMANKTARAWGQGNQGQLGNGGTTRSATPVNVKGLTGIVGAVSAASTNAYATRP